MSDEFLRKLYEMSDGDYKIFDRYRVGSEVGLSNSQTDDIIDDLHNMGLIKKIGETKILMTLEGKQETEIESELLCYFSDILNYQVDQLNRKGHYFIYAIVQISYRRLTWKNILDDKCKILLSKERNIYVTK
jgi:Mn-dependent DtxR family transcriptional regulator